MWYVISRFSRKNPRPYRLPCSQCVNQGKRVPQSLANLSPPVGPRKARLTNPVKRKKVVLSRALRNDRHWALGAENNPANTWPGQFRQERQLSQCCKLRQFSHTPAQHMPLAWNEIRHRAIKFANENAQAHTELDRAVDRCYRPLKFDNDRQRVEYLFQLYEQLTAPLIAAAKPKRARRAQPSL